jgi:hypothetical protein
LTLLRSTQSRIAPDFFRTATGLEIHGDESTFSMIFSLSHLSNSLTTSSRSASGSLLRGYMTGGTAALTSGQCTKYLAFPRPLKISGHMLFQSSLFPFNKSTACRALLTGFSCSQHIRKPRAANKSIPRMAVQLAVT